MEKNRTYVDAPADVSEALAAARVIGDFLPPPEALVFREATQKVTIELSRKSIGFFKDAARQARVPYQKLIRRVLDLYAGYYASPDSGAGPSCGATTAGNGTQSPAIASRKRGARA